MQISERVVMSYKDGPEVQIPKMLIQEDSDGQKWLKVRPSHYAIAKLLLGHLEEFKNCRQPSLAASQQLVEIRKMLLDKITTALGLASAAETEQDDLFGQGNEGDDAKAKAAAGHEEDDQAPKRRKVTYQKAPPTMDLELGGIACTFKTPATGRESDIIIMLDAKQLTALADFVLQDISGCLQVDAKRSYKRTGQYRKVRTNSQEFEQGDE